MLDATNRRIWQEGSGIRTERGPQLCLCIIVMQLLGVCWKRQGSQSSSVPQRLRLRHRRPRRMQRHEQGGGVPFRMLSFSPLLRGSGRGLSARLPWDLRSARA